LYELGTLVWIASLLRVVVGAGLEVNSRDGCMVKWPEVDMKPDGKMWPVSQYGTQGEPSRTRPLHDVGGVILTGNYVDGIVRKQLLRVFYCGFLEVLVKGDGR
jgi:hypothetical protein